MAVTKVVSHNHQWQGGRGYQIGRGESEWSDSHRPMALASYMVFLEVKGLTKLALGLHKPMKARSSKQNFNLDHKNRIMAHQSDF